MTNPKPWRSSCEVCGKPLNRNNTSGLCAGLDSTPECRRVRAGRIRQANGVQPRVRSTCTHPGGCPEPVHGNGYCVTHAARLRNTGNVGPAELIRKPIKIRAGDTFGRWMALEGYDSKVSRRVLCRCECGIERRVLAPSLQNRQSRSCGCLRPGPPRTPTRGPYLLQGGVYGRLTLLEQAERKDSLVRCLCECGIETVKRAADLRVGHTKSCGCLRFTHGQSRHPLFNTWTAMMARTTQPGHKDYPSYGGRGITVCERWQGMPDGFLCFAADVGERPSGRSLDRIDNDLGYSPDNVRWSTPKEQSANQRRVATLTLEVARLTRLLESS